MKNQDIINNFTIEQQEILKQAHSITKEIKDNLIIKLIKNTINSIIATYKSISLIPEDETINLLDAISKYFQNLAIIIDTYSNNTTKTSLNTYLINPETGYPYIVEQNRSIYGERYETIYNTIHNIEQYKSIFITKKRNIKYYSIENLEITLYIAEYKRNIIIITAKTNTLNPSCFEFQKYHSIIKKQLKDQTHQKQEIYNLIVNSEFDLNYIHQNSFHFSKKDA